MTGDKAAVLLTFNRCSDGSNELMVIELEYDDSYRFSEGLADVIKDGKYGFIDKTGKTLIGLQFEYAPPFLEGMSWIQIRGKWGFIRSPSND